MNDREQKGKVDYDSFVKCLKIANINATKREVEVLLSELD